MLRKTPYRRTGNCCREVFCVYRYRLLPCLVRDAESNSSQLFNLCRPGENCVLSFPKHAFAVQYPPHGYCLLKAKPGPQKEERERGRILC